MRVSLAGSVLTDGPDLVRNSVRGVVESDGRGQCQVKMSNSPHDH